MTKEQILKEKFKIPPIGGYNPVHEAMDEYAKQVSIYFVDWLGDGRIGLLSELFDKFKNKQP